VLGERQVVTQAGRRASWTRARHGRPRRQGVVEPSERGAAIARGDATVELAQEVSILDPHAGGDCHRGHQPAGCGVPDTRRIRSKR
jgi:hypothetical protein